MTCTETSFTKFDYIKINKMSQSQYLQNLYMSYIKLYKKNPNL